MILLGDQNIPSDHLIKINSFDDINKTPSDSIVLFKYDLDLMKYCDQNNLRYAVIIESITQVVYANILNATYALVDKTMAKTIQDIADNYMYDTKILAKIEFKSDIEWVVLNGIDGAIIK